jgi:2-oxoglutarate dehydrogenase E1 component
MRKGQKLFYAGRVSSATPAVGYKKLHAIQQKELVTAAITLGGGETKE